MGKRKTTLTAGERDYLRGVLDKYGPRLDGWMRRIALRDPAEATRLYVMLTEFVRPKLSRSEHLVADVTPTYEQLIAEARQLGIPDAVLFAERGAPPAQLTHKTKAH